MTPSGADIGARKSEITLIDLGGLQDPFWPVEVPVAYARAVIEACGALAPSDIPVHIVVSQGIAERLRIDRTSCRPLSEMPTLLSRSHFAFLTPGLGNIYDAANSQTPAVWLPPANDSQGRQLHLLRSEGLYYPGADWEDLGVRVDYLQEQSFVMAAIKERISWLGTVEGRARLVDTLRRSLSKLEATEQSSQDNLIRKFGRGGADAVVTIVCDWIQSGM